MPTVIIFNRGSLVTLFIAASFPAFSLAPVSFARDAGKNPEEAKSDKDSIDKDKSDSDEEPKLSVTEHTIMIGGKPVKCKATAGYLV